MPLDRPALVPRDAKHALGETPALGCTDRDIVVVAPHPWVGAVGRLVPRVERCQHGGAVVAIKTDEHVRVVVARRDKPRALPGRAMIAAEHRAQCGAAPQRRCETGAVVDDAVLCEELRDLVVELVVDAVRVAVYEVDDRVLVEEALDRKSVV